MTREDRVAAMAQDQERIDQTTGAGAAVFGLIGSLLIWLTIGAGEVAKYAWVGIIFLLVLGMKLLPARLAQPLTLVCHRVGTVVWGIAMAFFLLAPGALAYTFSTWVVETLPRWLQVGILVVWVLLLAGVSVLLYSRSLREQCRQWLAQHPNPVVQAFSWRKRVPALGAVALYINFMVVAMGCFASVAFLLHGLTPPLFLPKARPVDHGSLADFLLWHVLDAIPGLKVPETIKWEAPLTYERVGAGWLLLLFKVMVIVPVVSGIAHYLNDEEKEKEQGGARNGSRLED
ncbi:MAG TPA: hypothetical protein VL948_21550 [Verrucomicrobiae bacterium]|nr:hypothetical protein [Verrucomicrobiae bacterium]